MNELVEYVREQILICNDGVDGGSVMYWISKEMWEIRRNVFLDVLDKVYSIKKAQAKSKNTRNILRECGYNK